MKKIKNFNSLKDKVGLAGTYKRVYRQESNVRVDMELYKAVKKFDTHKGKAFKLSKLINELLIDFIFEENLKKLFLADEILIRCSTLFEKSSMLGLIFKFNRSNAVSKIVVVEESDDGAVKMRLGKARNSEKLRVLKVILDYSKEILVLTSAGATLAVEKITWKSDGRTFKGGTRKRVASTYSAAFERWNFSNDVTHVNAIRLKTPNAPKRKPATNPSGDFLPKLTPGRLK